MHHPLWYAALGRLTGYTAHDHWAAHYPVISGVCGGRAAMVTARCRAVGVTQSRILEEMKREPHILYAAGYRLPDGSMAYFAGPDPSLQNLRYCGAPEWRFWYHAESDSYFTTATDEEVKQMMKTLDGCLCTEIDSCRAYLVRLEDATVTPVARWDGVTWIRKKEKSNE